jgi:hypothetical protein
MAKFAEKPLRCFLRAETVFALLSLFGIIVASYEIARAPLHVDACSYLKQGGFFDINPEANFIEGLHTDIQRLAKNIVFCERNDCFVPLYPFWAKGVLRATDSYLLAAHMPQVFWLGVLPGLLALWLYKGPLRLEFAGSFLAGWSVLWSSYLLAVSRMGWLQPSVLTLMLLHLFAVNAFFRGSKQRQRPVSPWVLFFGMVTSMAMVLQHGTSVYLIAVILILLLVLELNKRPRRFPVRTSWYLVIVLPAVITLYSIYQCTFPEKSPFYWGPLSTLWGVMMRYNNGSPFTAMGWELVIPGCVGFVLSIKNDRKYLIPFYYLAVYMACFILLSGWPHYRYWAPWFPVLAISTGYAFQFGWRRLPRWVSTAVIIIFMTIGPIRTHQSLLAVEPSFWTNPIAWKFHDGGRGLRAFDRMRQALEVLSEKKGEERILVLHNYAGLLYCLEAGLVAKHVGESELLRERPTAFIATTWAWSDSKRIARLLSEYRRMFYDGAGMTLFMAK